MACSREVEVATALKDFMLVCWEDLDDDPEDLRRRLRDKDTEASAQVTARSPGNYPSGTMQVSPSEEEALKARADLAKFLKSKVMQMEKEDPSVGRSLSDSWRELWANSISTAAQVSYERFTDATDKILKRSHSGDLADVVGRTWCLVFGFRCVVCMFKKMVDDGATTLEDSEMKQKVLQNHVIDDINRRGVVWKEGEGSWVSVIFKVYIPLWYLFWIAAKFHLYTTSFQNCQSFPSIRE